jgi:hypothetical protein
VEISTNYFEVDGRFMACAFDRDNLGPKGGGEGASESEAKFRDLAEKSVAGDLPYTDGILRYVNARISEKTGLPDR